ncbi:hypothetical protein [Halorhabdus rudnickae]|uniref:hypothetical protein n=1 Tax=Halorhabdus rudnickae TaxID=1775544 RepID=UPI001AEFD04A|nr:hypothetical protein [Halorhabdus rudnickae]
MSDDDPDRKTGPEGVDELWDDDAADTSGDNEATETDSEDDRVETTGEDDTAELTGEDDETDPFEVIKEPETGDPFDRIDVEDRDADPFERLDDHGTSPEADADMDADAEHFDASGADTEPGAESDPAAMPGETATQGTPPGDEDDPFSNLGRDERTGDPFDGLAGERVDGEDATRPDAELWEDLSRSEVEPETERHGQRRFAEVSKHTYCERCEYFSDPPEIACAHEGTDIIEFVDFETVRVADCPVVAEREQLADMDRER